MRHLCWTITLLAVVLASGAAMAVPAENAVPGVVEGLPQWTPAVFNDYPVQLTLADKAQLDRLLAAVPIASFSRDQIQPTPDGLIFSPRVTDREAAALTAAGFVFTRLPDLEQAGRRAVEAFWAEQQAKGFPAGDPAKALYYPTHAQIGSDFAALAAAHPDIARTFTWGTSVQGRELWGIVISDDVQHTEAEPEVRLSSTMHGDEPPDMVMLWNLAQYLVNNYNQPGYEAVTDLVNTTEIHIMPLFNPDGYVADTRTNANGVDLNRNFPEPAGQDPYQEQETIAFMNYGLAHHFVISQNGHSGALVVNYPWDYTYTRAPDNDALIDLSLEYSTYNLPMYNGSFTQGITDGADWYVANGTLQDWSYTMTDCIDVTIETNNTKWPAASALDGLWDDNRESLMHFIKASHYGVHGVVTGSDTGLPLDAMVTVTGNAMPVHTDPSHGDYYKLLPTGTFELTFIASGYLNQTISGVSTVWGTPTVLNVVMNPVAHGEIHGTVSRTGGQEIAAQINIYSMPLNTFETAVQTDVGNVGAYSVSLPYGDYRLEAVADGYTTQSQTATAGASPVTLDFSLAPVETVDLFASDFESSLDGWTGGWGLATPPTGHDSTGSMTDSPAANYADNATNTMTMDAGLDLSSATAAEVSFWAKWNIEDMWDGCFFEVSTDGGSGWTPLSTAFTGPATGQGAQTPSGVPCFDNIQSAWVLNTVSLTAYLGQADVRFRFRLGSDTSVNRDGYYVDDFAVTVTRPAGISPVPPASAVLLSVKAYPNPFNPQTTLKFVVPNDGSLTLRVYDLQGRLVRSLVDGYLPAGAYQRIWDGRDDTGAPTGSGIYFAIAKGAAEQAVTKLSLIK